VLTENDITTLESINCGRKERNINN
jgi:hypothetical protein